MSSPPALFQPVKVGELTLTHHIVLPPLTRCRANKAHVMPEFAAEYYAQRAVESGTLLIAEATAVFAQTAGFLHVPGIWADNQIAAWKRVTEAVHAKGSFIFLQLWAGGRVNDPDVLNAEDPSFVYVGVSDVKLSTRSVAPRPLTTPEIKERIAAFATAAYNAVHRAGFDGVEVHGANGCLIDEFTQDVTNRRTDEYGGSIENRSRFALEVVSAVVDAVGARKTGLRLSPWGEFWEMRMDDPVPQFSHLVERLRKQHPDLAYLHLIEPRTTGDRDREVRQGESNDFIRAIWAPRPVISAGGFTRETAIEHAEKTGDLIAIGRAFISNPDLPRRLRENISITKWDRSTFYTFEDPKGYIDYPFAD
ncbi:FMN-linked oxidoreductase [Obba rivulosa]|uniref:FMN-linked oxidoreductase n=1 Tax=Obba rivulosa TaxID=1052685 RepID=A0A8E2DKN1_9APHY|nr:FMN-linked oxidoreductase [Obba rivulosa]